MAPFSASEKRCRLLVDLVMTRATTGRKEQAGGYALPCRKNETTAKILSKDGRKRFLKVRSQKISPASPRRKQSCLRTANTTLNLVKNMTNKETVGKYFHYISIYLLLMIVNYVESICTLIRASGSRSRSSPLGSQSQRFLAELSGRSVSRSDM